MRKLAFWTGAAFIIISPAFASDAIRHIPDCILFLLKTLNGQEIYSCAVAFGLGRISQISENIGAP